VPPHRIIIAERVDPPTRAADAQTFRSAGGFFTPQD
jgi:hypothetical protein